MILLILLIQDLLSSLLELTLPLPVLIVQLFDIFLHLYCFWVILRPILILSFEQTQRQVDILQHLLNLVDYFLWGLRWRRWWRRNR